MLAMMIFFRNCLYLGLAATSKRRLQPWKDKEISMVLEEGGWGRHVGIRCYENRENNNKEKNLELLKLHMDGDASLNSQAILTFLMRWLSFMKLKPKQIAECNQQKRAGPSTAGTKVNAAGLQLLEELLLSEG
ncbi:hypothetical protein Tco_0215757 [Tanacetum coccineum]